MVLGYSQRMLSSAEIIQGQGHDAVSLGFVHAETTPEVVALLLGPSYYEPEFAPHAPEEQQPKKQYKKIEDALARRVQWLLKSSMVGTTFEKVFGRFDKNRDGVLTFDEFRRVLRVILRIQSDTLTEDEVTAFMAGLDNDHSGTLDMNELADFLNHGSAALFAEARESEDTMTADRPRPSDICSIGDPPSPEKDVLLSPLCRLAGVVAKGGARSLLPTSICANFGEGQLAAKRRLARNARAMRSPPTLASARKSQQLMSASQPPRSRQWRWPLGRGKCSQDDGRSRDASALGRADVDAYSLPWATPSTRPNPASYLSTSRPGTAPNTAAMPAWETNGAPAMPLELPGKPLTPYRSPPAGPVRRPLSKGGSKPRELFGQELFGQALENSPSSAFDVGMVLSDLNCDGLREYG